MSETDMYNYGHMYNLPGKWIGWSHPQPAPNANLFRITLQKIWAQALQKDPEYGGRAQQLGFHFHVIATAGSKPPTQHGQTLCV